MLISISAIFVYASASLRDLIATANELPQAESKAKIAGLFPNYPNIQIPNEQNGANLFLQAMAKYSSENEVNNATLLLAKANQKPQIVIEEFPGTPRGSLQYLDRSSKLAHFLIHSLKEQPVKSENIDALEAIWKFLQSRKYVECLLVEQKLRVELYSILITKLKSEHAISPKLERIVEQIKPSKIQDFFPTLYADSLRFHQSSTRSTRELVDWTNVVPRYEEAKKTKVIKAFIRLTQDFKDDFPNNSSAIEIFDQQREGLGWSWQDFNTQTISLTACYRTQRLLEQTKRLISAGIALKSGRSRSVDLPDFDGKNVRMRTIQNGWHLYSVSTDKIDQNGEQEMNLQGLENSEKGDIVIRVRKNRD